MSIHKGLCAYLLSGLPFPDRNNRAMFMAALLLCLELSQHRGDDGEARCPGDVNIPGMVLQVRPRLCCPAEKKASSVWSEVAPGRRVRQDEWSPALLMAARGPQRSGHRYPGAGGPRPLGKLAFLSQAAPCGREHRASSSRTSHGAMLQRRS
jgi:hypothetical protein